MADQNRNELNAIVDLMGDMLLELQGIRTDQKALVEGQDRMARTFDKTMTLVVDRLTGIETKIGAIDEKIDSYGKQLVEIQNINDRLRKPEEFVYNKSA